MDHMIQPSPRFNKKYNLLFFYFYISETYAYTIINYVHFCGKVILFANNGQLFRIISFLEIIYECRWILLVHGRSITKTIFCNQAIFNNFVQLKCSTSL